MTAQLPQPVRPSPERLNITVSPEIPAMQNDIDGLAVLRAIRRRLPLILLTTVALTAAVAPLILSAPKFYRAETRLMLSAPPEQYLLPGPDTVRSAALNIDVEAERLHDRANIVALDKVFNLSERPEFNASLRPSSPSAGIVARLRDWLAPGSQDPAPAPSAMDQVVARVDDAISVRRHSDTNVIDVAFTSQDPELAAAGANALVGIYLGSRTAQWQIKVETARKWLSDRIAAQQARLSAAIAALRAFDDSNQAVALQGDTSAGQDLRLLAQRRASILGDRLDLQTKVEAIGVALASGLAPSVEEPENIAALRHELQVRQLAAEKLALTYGRNYGEDITARAQITTLEAMIRNALVAWKAALQQQETALAKQADEIDQLLGRKEVKVAQIGTATKERDSLDAAITVERTALQQLERQRHDLDGQAALPALDLEVLAPATIPLKPLGQSHKLLLVVAALAAGLAAVTLALVLELLDRTLRSPQQLRPGIRLEFAGFLPVLSRRQARDPAGLFVNNPGAAFPEGAQLTLQSIDQRSRDQRLRGLAVAGAGRNVGTSVSARVLALGLIKRGHQVLLADLGGNGRAHWPATRPARPPFRGPAAALQGKAALERLVRRDPASGLDILETGPGAGFPPSPAQIAEIIAFAVGTGRLVVFDCPPILESSAALAAATHCDETVIVADWGRTPRHTVERAAARLSRNVDGRVPLLVINRLNARRHMRYGFEDILA